MTALEVTHTTTYTYTHPTLLNTHLLRLVAPHTPQQTITHQSFDIVPCPLRRDIITINKAFLGLQLSFPYEPTEQLAITAKLQARTPPSSDDLSLFDTVSPTLEQLELLKNSGEFHLHLIPTDYTPILISTVHTMQSTTNYHIGQYIQHVINWIHTCFQREFREFGPPRTSSETLQRQYGSCRDYAVLVMDLLRHSSIPTRFVSGYFYDISELRDTFDLHAWIECYLPSLGWIGLDPSTGKRCNHHYITLCASYHPNFCAPIEGTFTGNSSSQLASLIHINEIPQSNQSPPLSIPPQKQTL